MGGETSSLTEMEVAAYAHEDDRRGVSLYYRRRFQRAQHGGSAGFNVAAAIVGPIWCFWRKLWLVGLLLYGLEFASAFAVGVLSGLGVPMVEKVLLGERFAFAVFLVRIPFGFLANGIYLKAAERAAGRVRSTTGEANLRQLAALGGVSGAGVLLAMLINGALRMLDWLFAAP